STVENVSRRHTPNKERLIMRFFFIFFALIALTVGCGDSESEYGSTTPAITGNQVSFEVSGMT
ncbi:MAG: hypothetical protein VB912_12810, partial [Pirellulaceae bacterium]